MRFLSAARVLCGRLRAGLAVFGPELLRLTEEFDEKVALSADSSLKHEAFAMTGKLKPSLAIVVPCYNEEEVLPETAARVHCVVDELIMADKIIDESYICFVDDGSTDRTWAIICDLN